MMAPQLSLNTHTHILQPSRLQYDTMKLEIAQEQPVVLKCYILLRTVCFALPPLPGVEERADHKLFLKPAKRRLHSTSRVHSVIFRRAEEITPPLMEILAQFRAQIWRENRKRHRHSQIQEERCWGRLLMATGPVFGVLTLSWTPATVRLAWRSEYVSRCTPSLVSPFP